MVLETVFNLIQSGNLTTNYIYASRFISMLNKWEYDDYPKETIKYILSLLELKKEFQSEEEQFNTTMTDFLRPIISKH